MGAWGYKVFEDDSSLDALSDLADSKTMIKDMKKYFTLVLKSEYVDYDDASYAIAAAAIIDGVLNQVKHLDDDEQYDEIIGSVKKEDAFSLKQDAVKAIERILAKESELCELWKENENEYVNWRNEKLEIISRLK